jgi:hypothetical protein
MTILLSNMQQIDNQKIKRHKMYKNRKIATKMIIFVDNIV